MKRAICGLLLGMCLIAGTLSGAFGGQSPQEPAKKPAPPQMYQLVIFELGPAWLKDKPVAQQPGIQEHAAYMTKLEKEGVLVLGGPLFDDKTKSVNGAMMVLTANTPEEARKILEADPAHALGLIQINEIRSLVITGTSWKPAEK